MKPRFLLALFALSMLLWLQAAAQDNQDDKAHIQPRATPTPAPSGSPGNTPPPRQAGDEPPPTPSGNASGRSATGESSSRDSQIDLSARPSGSEPAPAAEDDSVLKPWDPHKADKDVEVGEYYLKLKNYRAALERFNDALVYKSDDAAATYDLAFTQEKLDLLAPAEQNYRKYLKILPHGPKAKEAEEAIQRIGPHVEMRKTAERNGDPTVIAAHDVNVGETYLSGNHFDAARERFEEAMRLTPDNPLIYFRLGQAYQGMQHLDPARTFYRKYLELEPKGKFAKNAKKAIADIDWTLGKSK